MNCKIYIATHTDFDCPVKSPIYDILDSRKLFPDDKAPNGLNALFYSELLSYKYVADKFRLEDYVGFCGYRKYFSFMDKIPDIPTLVDRHGCIAAEKNTRPRSIYKQYAKSFCFADMDITKGIVASLYPAEYPSLLEMLEGNWIYPFNMFIMRWSRFIMMMEYVFDILDKLVEVLGTDIVSRINSHPHIYLGGGTKFRTIPFQYRIGGNIGERLISAYIMHHFPDCITFPAVFTSQRAGFNPIK